MDTNIIIIVLLVVTLGAVFYALFRRAPSGSTPENQQLLLNQLNDLRRELQQSSGQNRQEVQQRLDLMNTQLNKTLSDTSGTLQRNFAQTSGIIKDVTEKLTKLDETNKQVLGFSEQLQSLEHILKNPKQRGILGEYWLETLLGQVLQPTQYEMQFELGVDETSGAKLIPDAIIRVRDLLIPIDAKFSLENYNRISVEEDPVRREQLEKEFKNDVKKRIDETSKYIRPDKGTTDFAFMFVPAEGVYHNLVSANVGAVQVNARNLIGYAFEKHVMIVSPTSFYAYLQTVLFGLKALKIEDSVKDIQKQTELLMRHLKAFEDYHNKVGRQLETTMKTYSESSNELKKIDKDIYRITEGVAGKELDPLVITARQED